MDFDEKYRSRTTHMGSWECKTGFIFIKSLLRGEVLNESNEETKRTLVHWCISWTIMGSDVDRCTTTMTCGTILLYCSFGCCGKLNYLAVTVCVSKCVIVAKQAKQK